MTDSRTTVAPTRILTRAPNKIRERISRPKSSIPKGCCQFGPDRRFASCGREGSYGASQVDNTVDNARTPTITIPAAAILFVRRNSFIPDSRIDDRIEKIGYQVDQNVSDGDRQNATL